MKTPVISIIIPVYNVEQYLPKCIESILIQTFKDFELILINDGSSDNSGEICDLFAKKDERIKVVHKKNEGVSITRNTGIDLSVGNYIMFADADDFVEPYWCEILLSALITDNNKSLVLSGFSIHNLRENNITKTSVNLDFFEENCKLRKEDFFLLFLNQMLNPLWNKIYFSSIIKDNNIRFVENLSLGEDLTFNLEYLYRAGNNIIVINKPMYNYLLRNRGSLDNKYYEDLFIIYKSIYNTLEKYILLLGANIDTAKPDLYKSYLFKLNVVLNNTFNKENKLPFRKKIQYNSEILKSGEFTKCLKYANLDGISKTYIALLKLNNSFLIFIYIKFLFMKHNVNILLKNVYKRIVFWN